MRHSLTIFASVALLVSTVVAETNSPARFADFRAEAPFDVLLKASPLLMEVGGVKVLHIPHGGRALLSVATTPVETDSGADRVRMMKVCRAKAVAGLLKDREGVHVDSLMRSEDNVLVKIENGRETATSVNELQDTIEEQASGVMQELPTVATWYSPDRTLFYLAIGQLMDEATPSESANKGQEP